MNHLENIKGILVKVLIFFSFPFFFLTFRQSNSHVPLSLIRNTCSIYKGCDHFFFCILLSENFIFLNIYQLRPLFVICYIAEITQAWEGVHFKHENFSFAKKKGAKLQELSAKLAEVRKSFFEICLITRNTFQFSL